MGATDLILATPAMLASQGLGVAKKKVKKKKKKMIDVEATEYQKLPQDVQDIHEETLKPQSEAN